MASKLEAFAKKNLVKYFLFNFTDLRGVQRSKLVPASAVGAMERDGAGFAGFAAYLDMTPAHPDMFAVPDIESVTQLPWKPEVAWIACDLMMENKPVEQAPRNVLKKVLSTAESQGLHVKSGVEAEYHLVEPSGNDISDPQDSDVKPCYDQQALMRRYDVVSEICDYMQTLGWAPYQNDHEDANGQFEMNWTYDGALITADRHAFFKFMVKSIAEQHGLRATFMPKPFSNLTGNGCHVHMSVWNQKRKNLFLDEKAELGLSSLALEFLGGVIEHAEALCVLTNPIVNSYKRINAPVTNSGATWSPNTVTWSGNNRTHMVRVPDEGRFEFRLADGAANPYLLQAGFVAAGLFGIAKKLDPGKRIDLNMYTDGHKIKNARKLPLYLLDAIRLFENNKDLKEMLGESFSNSYVKLKFEEWDTYSQHLSDWERQTALDI